MLSAIIIIVGNEILNGFTKDLNANFLILNLLKYNIDVDRVVFVKDEQSLIIHELQAVKSVNFVFLTGGLGPTTDDVTSDALSVFFNKQKPTLIKNEIGTAPGLWYKNKKIDYFSFPGVPSEMRLMAKNIFSLVFKNQIEKEKFFQVNTIGITEREIYLLLKNFEKEIPNSIKLSYLPENNIVKLRFYDSSDKLKGFEFIKVKLNQILGSYIFSYGQKSLQEILIFNLIKKSNTMFGRVGIIKHTGDTDVILKILRSKEDLFQSADGLISVIYIKISDSEFLGLSQWETKHDMENAASLVQEIMSSFMDKIAEPPMFKEGEIGFKFKK